MKSSSHAAVTILELAKGFIPVRRRFKLGAIVSEKTAGGCSALSGFIVIDWMKGQIFFTRHHGNTMGVREQMGHEEWHRAISALPADFFEDWAQAHDGSPEMGSISRHMNRGRNEAQRMIVEAARSAQEILNAARGEVCEPVKDRVRKVLGVR